MSERVATLLYHRVYAHETFEDAAQKLWDILHRAQQTEPDTSRELYLDIDGHRNDAGGFDADMFELQRHFILKAMLPFLTEMHCPLFAGRNTAPQRNDIPVLAIFPEGASRE